MGEPWKPVRESEKVEKPALQKALTDWKIACQAAAPTGKRRSQIRKSTSAPTISNASVKRTMLRTRWRKSTSGATSAALAVTASWCSERRRPSARITSVVNVRIPSPPSWIRRRTKACPAVVKYVAVSTTISPVTHTALVDV